MASKPFASGHDLAAADVNDLVGVIERSTSTVTVANTVTETSVYSKSIAANSMSTDRVLTLAIAGTILVNTGGGGVLTFRVKFGATTVLADAVTFVDDTDSRAWRLEIDVGNKGATNSQWADAKLWIQSAVIVAATTGSGAIDVMDGGYLGNNAAEDTTAAKTLDVTVQWTGASASASISKQRALLTLA